MKMIYKQTTTYSSRHVQVGMAKSTTPTKYVQQ